MTRSKEWLEGFEASKRGVAKPRNPYTLIDEQKTTDWQDGWETQFFGEEP